MQQEIQTSYGTNECQSTKTYDSVLIHRIDKKGPILVL